MNITTDFEMALFDLNMAACRDSRPSLYKQLTNTEETNRYWLFESDHSSGAHNLIDVINDKLFYEQSNPLGSMADHLETCINNLQGIMLCLGFGLGYGPLMLVQQKNFVARSIIIIEPDPEVLLVAFKTLDCREIIESKDVLLLIGYELTKISPAVTGHLIQENRLVSAKNFQIIDLPAAYTANKSYFDSAIQKVRHAILESVTVYGNCPADALLGLDTSLANYRLHAGLPGIKSLSGAFRGKPGIVVATGPSLDKNVHLLRDLDENAVIVSVDASLSHLLDRKLKAHFVTSVERIKATSKFFEDLDPATYQETFLVGSPVCHPATFEKYKGPIISCEREHGYTKLLDLDTGTLTPGPSAGNMAYRLLAYLGCDPIILIGQDLALSEDGKTHAKGNTYGDHQSPYLQEPIEVEGNFCKILKSNPILRMFHHAYEYDVSLNPGTVINATEGGAKINGTEILSLQEAIDQYVTNPIFDSHSNLTVSNFIASKLEAPTTDAIDIKTLGFIDRLKTSIAYLQGVDTTVAEAQENVIRFKEHLAGVNDPEKKSPTRQKTKQDLIASLDAISSLTLDPTFRIVAQDVVSAVFIHTMMDYNAALANAKDADEQDAELARNVENLANNFGVLNRYILKLLEGHLALLEQDSNSEKIVAFKSVDHGSQPA